MVSINLELLCQELVQLESGPLSQNICLKPDLPSSQISLLENETPSKEQISLTPVSNDRTLMSCFDRN